MNVKRLVSGLFYGVLTLLLALAVEPARAEDPSAAPMAPEFLNFMEEGFRASSVEFPFDGILPSPLDLSHVVPEEEGITAQAFPLRYDLRQESKLSEVKNQGNYGTCWAHAALGSLESGLLPARSENLSEWHLAYFAYSGDVHFTRRSVPSGSHPVFDQGGNSWQAAALMARWNDPVPENVSPYGGDLPDGTEVPTLHLTEVLYLPGLGALSSGEFNSSAIKQGVMEHGAVAGSMYWSDSLYRSSTLGFYSSTERTTNHGILIVGWDDDYSRDNFNGTPPGDGAWLVRNSWGTWFGDEGYFYISYYDKSLEGGFVFKGGDVDDFDRVYQHDPLGWVRSMGYGSETAWFASVFTASGEENLEAVSFYTAAPSAEYDLYVYTGVGISAPTSGTRRVDGVSGVLDETGYHVVELPSAVSLAKGERFSAVVRLRTPGYGYPVPLEDRIGGYTDDASAGAEESYISSSGSSWSDVTKTFSANANVCLKAFTTTVTEFMNRPPTLPTVPSPSDGEEDVGEAPTLTWSADDPDGDDLTYRISFGEAGKTASVSTVEQAAFAPGTLDPGTAYTWSVTVLDGRGGQTSGPVWTFETAAATPVNRVPESPLLWGPDGNTPVNAPSVRLEWSCLDPDGDDLTYEVWLGSSQSDLIRVATVETESHFLQDLLPGTRFWWKVVASDGRGGKVSSATDSFETGQWEILSETESLSGTNLEDFRVLALGLDPRTEGWNLPSGSAPTQATDVNDVSVNSLGAGDLEGFPLDGAKGLTGAAFSLDLPGGSGQWVAVDLAFFLGQAELGQALYSSLLDDMSGDLSSGQALWGRVALGKVLSGSWTDLAALASDSGAISVSYEKSRFVVRLQLAVVDGVHGARPIQVMEGDYPYLVIFDGAADGRIEDPLVFTEVSGGAVPDSDPTPTPGPDISGGGGGCNLTSFPLLWLALPLLTLLKP